MDTNRVDIFHIADSDAVSCAVTHYFVFDFFPACDTSFYQDLSYSGKTQSVLQNGLQLCLIMGDSTAASAKSIGRTQYYRITDGLCEGNTILHTLNNLGCRTGLSDLFHGILEFLTVLRLLDGSCCSSEELYPMGSKEPAFCKLHTKIQSGLSAKRRQDAVRFFFFNDLLEDTCC